MAATRQTHEPAATVISIVPFPIDEEKPGMQPGIFQIAPAKEGDFEMLLVKKCKHGVYLDENRPSLIVPTSPDEVAQAICFDYMKGQMGIEIGVAEPGLFWVWGDYVTEEKAKTLLRAEHAQAFREAERKQVNWFKNLVAQADDAWSKFHRRAMISEPQRIAASRLKLEREWVLDNEVEAAMSECSVCFEKVHPRAIVCRSCGAILNQTEYAKVQFTKTAQQVTATK